MPSTLESLDRVAVAGPHDRTVRLVYADALDETGNETDAARAEFIRTQIALETIPATEPRYIVPASRCRELFEANWLDWWRPIAANAGLPEPHTTKRRIRDRVARAVQRTRRRPANWPYTHTTSELTVHAAEYGISFKFVAGFPEEVRLLNLDTPEGGPELVHRWGDAIPLVRLSFASYLTPQEWERIAGSHLDRLTELSVERLMPETAEALAACSHLSTLTRLNLRPVGVNPEAVRVLVSHPAWVGLRSLTLGGRVPGTAVQALAAANTLEELEELDLTLGDPGELGNPVGQMLNDLLQVFIRSIALNQPAVQWIEFTPAVQALTEAPWVRQLRRLTLRPAEVFGFQGLFGGRAAARARGDSIPDDSVIALASALNRDKLETLVLPAAAITDFARRQVAAQLGDRAVFA